MTEKPVEVSITVNINGEMIQYTRKVEIHELESGISQVVQELGNKVLVAGLAGLDRDLRKRVPAGWRNIGTEERSILSSVVTLGLSGDAWQEQVLKSAHRHYDLEQTKLLISGGDGNQWVRRTFQRFGLQQEFVLDRFHLSRAARRAIGERTEAQAMVMILRQQGFPAVCQVLRQRIGQACGKEKKKLEQFYQYIESQQDGLLDLPHRGYSSELGNLGAIEGNVDKLVIHRMKGRGCCWKLKGARAMLALCQYKETLKVLAFDYLPMEIPEPYNRRKGVSSDRIGYVNGAMPIFNGPDQDKPWVNELHRYVHWQ